MPVFDSIVILGATATGKTKLAVQLAETLNGEIISADSRQVFKGMDIGTGKDLTEYSNNGKPIPYHLIDILDAGKQYNVDLFKKDCYQAFSAIKNKGRLPIICGGTGMYIHSILKHQPFTAVPVDEALRRELALLNLEELKSQFLSFNQQDLKHADLSSKKRLIRAIEIAEFLQHNQLPTTDFPKIKPVVFGLKSIVEQTRASIGVRLENRFDNGLIAEVEQLSSQGISHQMLVFYGMEYKFVSKFLVGELNIQELKTMLCTAICQYAKRQNTFFRKMEKDGVNIHWLDAALPTNTLRDFVLEKIYHTNIINQSID